MRKPGWTRSIVPNGDDQTACPVHDDYFEVDALDVGFAASAAVLEAQYHNPVRVVGSTLPKNGRRTSRGRCAPRVNLVS
jgi:hypothetical protein